MVEGSTKVFVLATRQLSRVDMPRLVYQVRERERERERKRLDMKTGDY
ncbi:hypothetical protein E2C01_094448 [Portunus trituberculatus]|uniref:Uncharacterized protein n=1 Tax=Portunus trituberculatus TaxID=210409 RepID=A0A5B7K399_PORTR|nr:hypothetical protein [Portunus trituberculatus]